VAPSRRRLAAEESEAPMELGRPPSARLLRARTPPVTKTGPVKVLAVLSVSVPLPAFTRPPVPAMAPAPEKV
jgi:hypothetical protein